MINEATFVSKRAGGYPNVWLPDRSVPKTTATSVRIDMVAVLRTGLNLCLEVISAVKSAIGPRRVGNSAVAVAEIPGHEDGQGCQHVIRGLKDLDLAYLYLIKAWVCRNVVSEDRDKNNAFVEARGNISPVILAGGFTPVYAKAAVGDELRDRDAMIAFGRDYISSPDLPFRIWRGLALNPMIVRLFTCRCRAKGTLTTN